MPKKYQLLIDSPELHNGAVAELQEKEEVYKVVFSRGAHYLSPEQVENRPTVWQEIVEEPEKKIVERWRGSLHETYYKMGHNKSSIPTTEMSNHENAKNHSHGDHFHSKKVSDRAITRVEIMCRLMGLAETIEEGSTECKHGVWTLTCNSHGELLPYDCTHYHIDHNKLASFSSLELAKLYRDSAGQDAIDWYGAVK